MIMEYSINRRLLIRLGMNNIVVADIHNKVSDAVGRQNINIYNGMGKEEEWKG